MHVCIVIYTYMCVHMYTCRNITQACFNHPLLSNSDDLCVCPRSSESVQCSKIIQHQQWKIAEVTLVCHHIDRQRNVLLQR